MLEQTGISFIEPHWHFFVAGGINFIVLLMLNMNPRIYVQFKWLYYVAPLFFTMVVYFCLGALSAIFGWS